MAEQILDLAEVHARIEEQGGGGGPQRVGNIDIDAAAGAIYRGRLFNSTGQPLQVAFNQAIHRGRVHEAGGQLFAARVEPRPEQGTTGHLCAL